MRIPKPGEIRKAITPVVSGGLAWAGIVIASAPKPITATEWLAGGIILAGALGVYSITNDPKPEPLPGVEPPVPMVDTVPTPGGLPTPIPVPIPTPIQEPTPTGG